MSTLPAPHPDPVRQRVMEVLAPWRAVTSPLFMDVHNIPKDRPLLFIGNHTIYGFFDTALLLDWLDREQRIQLKSLGDHVHFKVPLWRDVLKSLGVVDGTRDAADALLAQRESILIFPGGAREVARRKHEKYPVIWKDRMGFARMAIKHGATLVPFACIGMDDALDVVLDAEDIHSSPLGPFLKMLDFRKDATMPLARGLGKTPIPRPERVYFKFMPPVRTADIVGRQDEDDVVKPVREEVRLAVQRGIAELLDYRDTDPDRPLVMRMLNKLVQRAGG